MKALKAYKPYHRVSLCAGIIGCGWASLFFGCGYDNDETIYQGIAASTSTGESATATKRGLPEPDPIPIPALIRVKIDVRNKNPISPILVVGLPGAVQGAGIVGLESGDYQAKSYSTEYGSFIAILAGQADRQIAVQFNQSKSAFYNIPLPGKGPKEPPEAIQDLPPIVPVAENKVLVRGQGYGHPGQSIIGINLATGDVVTAWLAEDFTFRFEIPALSGHAIEIYHDTQPLNESWTLIAP